MFLISCGEGIFESAFKRAFRWVLHTLITSRRSASTTVGPPVIGKIIDQRAPTRQSKRASTKTAGASETQQWLNYTSIQDGWHDGCNLPRLWGKYAGGTVGPASYSRQAHAGYDMPPRSTPRVTNFANTWELSP